MARPDPDSRARQILFWIALVAVLAPLAYQAGMWLYTGSAPSMALSDLIDGDMSALRSRDTWTGLGRLAAWAIERHVSWWVLCGSLVLLSDLRPEA